MASCVPAALLGKQIRVLKCISIYASDIHCSLELITQPGNSSAPEYEAVSYVWGPKEEHATVWCENLPGEEVAEKAVEVSANLASALRYIWTPLQRRHVLLWCDSLCINQNDPVEKAAQVAMMDRIFKSAVRVLIWLGSRDISNAFALLKKLVGHEDSTPDLPAIKLGLEEAQSIARLANNEWFCRVWTFQEARLAKSALVLCQYGEIEWSDFAGGITILIAKIDGPHAEAEFARHISFLVTEAGEDDETREAQYEKDETSGANVGRAADSLQKQRFLIFGESLHRKPATDLTELLFRNWYRAATDPRDKIYALLSDELLGDTKNKPNINYSISMVDLFTQTARRCININQNLKILQIAGMDHRRKYSLGWTHQLLSGLNSAKNYVPSWVPDWRQFEMDLAPVEINVDGIPGLAKEHPPEQQIEDSSRLLKLDGFALGVLSFDDGAGGRSELRMLPPNVKSVSQILESFQANDENLIIGPWPRPSFPPRNPASMGFGGFEARKMLLPTESLPTEARSGDWLCQLDGSVMPFVLRPAYQSDPQMTKLNGNGNKFALIGAAPTTWELVQGWKLAFISGTFVLT